MDGETNGSQEAAQGAQDAAQQQGQEQQETQQGQSQVGDETPDYEKQIAERDEKIASLEAQMAEAAKNAETAEQLRGEITQLKAQGESDRIDFSLQLAGVRNVKAARVLLAGHGKHVLAIASAGQNARAISQKTCRRHVFLTLNVPEVPQVRFHTAIDLQSGDTEFGQAKATTGKAINFVVAEKSAVRKPTERSFRTGYGEPSYDVAYGPDRTTLTLPLVSTDSTGEEQSKAIEGKRRQAKKHLRRRRGPSSNS